MSAESIISSVAIGLPPGKHPVYLHQIVHDHVGRKRPGPHLVGWVEQFSDGDVRARLLDAVQAARDARVLLEEHFVDAVVDGHAVRLGVFD